MHFLICYIHKRRFCVSIFVWIFLKLFFRGVFPSFRVGLQYSFELFDKSDDEMILECIDLFDTLCRN